MTFLVLAVVLFTLANARAARLVGERWGLETAMPASRLAVVVLLDVLILVAIGAAGNVWGAVALLPILAVVVMVSLRAASRGRGTDRAQSDG